jgi:hypothetical protein
MMRGLKGLLPDPLAVQRELSDFPDDEGTEEEVRSRAQTSRLKRRALSDCPDDEGTEARKAGLTAGRTGVERLPR